MSATHPHDDRYQRRLSRGRRSWDFVSGWAGWVPRWRVPLTGLLRDQLELRAGQSVLDVGCGRGELLGLLREEVGPEGRAVGIDYSAGMVRRAQERIDHEGWGNVEVHTGDASRPAFGQAAIDGPTFDAAVATFAISAMPDVISAVQNVHTALKPGGRFLVLDLRLAPNGWSRVLAWFLGLWYRLLAGWTGQDVLSALRHAFPTVEVIKGRRARGGSDPGWVFIAVATKEKAAST